MTQQHPITPPPELVEQWFAEWMQNPNCNRLAARVAQWGADQELEACCERILNIRDADALRAARRPKPLSLKEQAMRVLLECGFTLDGRIELEPEDIDIIHRALEQLPE